jgi:hypothetical protein
MGTARKRWATADTAAEMRGWAASAPAVARFVYGYDGPDEHPTAEAKAEAWRLYEAGLVLLVQRREPDGRFAYTAIRTRRAEPIPPEPPAHPNRRGAVRTISPDLASKCRAMWRRGMANNIIAENTGMTTPTLHAVLYGERCYAGDPDIITDAERTARTGRRRKVAGAR